MLVVGTVVRRIERKMNDILDFVRVALVLLFTITTYVLVVQVANDTTCASLGSDSQVVGKWLIRAISLCWW